MKELVMVFKGKKNAYEPFIESSVQGTNQ